DPIIQEFVVRRRQGVKQRSENLPDHLERRTERIEPTLPQGIRLEDCVLIGVDVVEILEIERAELWVRRIEYPKYKLPAPVPSASVAAGPLADVEAMVEAGPVVDADAMVEVEVAHPAELAVEVEPVANAEPLAQPAHDGQPSNESPTPPSDMSGRKMPPAVTTEPVAITAPAHGILQSLREITLVPGGHFGFSVAAEVLFQKFGLHVPLYRQQDSLAQSGWSPNRSTLGLIVANSAELFTPLAQLFRERVLALDLLGTDDTPVTLLTPREGDGSKQARFWLYRGRHGAPYDVFAFTDSRTRDGPDAFLEPFQGILSGDCYSGYVNIEQVTQGRIKFSACLSHARRYVFNAREQQPVLASQMLAQFRQLYDIEDRGRTMDDVHRWELRQRESVPVMNRLRKLLDGEAAKRVLPKSKFGETLGYLRNHWSAFQVYLGDGRVPIDNNDVERDLRRIAVGRNNWLFVGSEAAGERTATILTIVASAHRHDLDEWEYLRNALEQLARGRAAAGGAADMIDPAILESLLPDVWAKSHPESIRSFRTNEKQRRAEVRRFKRAERRRTQAQR
ncbi:MAG: IS66 family transposase, partial [Acidobacteriota bacterium]